MAVVRNSCSLGVVLDTIPPEDTLVVVSENQSESRMAPCQNKIQEHCRDGMRNAMMNSAQSQFDPYTCTTVCSAT